MPIGMQEQCVNLLVRIHPSPFGLKLVDVIALAVTACQSHNKNKCQLFADSQAFNRV